MGRHFVTRVRRFRVREEKKVIRVESSETQEQDHVRESLNLSRRRNEFWCDNRCSDKALRFGQFASVNEISTAEGLAPLKNWKAVVELKAHRGRLWKNVGKGPVDQGYVGVFVS